MIELKNPVTLNNGDVVRFVPDGDLFRKFYVDHEEDFFYDYYREKDLEENKEAVEAIYRKAIGCTCVRSMCSHSIPTVEKILETMNLYVDHMNEELFAEKEQRRQKSLTELDPTEFGLNYHVFKKTRTPKKRRNELNGPLIEHPYFNVEEVSCDSFQSRIVQILFLRYFHITFFYGRWITFNVNDQELLKPIMPYFMQHSYPPLEIMVKYANMELKRLKKDDNPTAPSCLVCTPVDATSTSADATATEEIGGGSIKSIVGSILQLSEEICDIIAGNQ